MEQLLCHLVGDYILQNDTMGLRKKEKSFAGLLFCIFHCIIYASVFLLITNIYAAILIGITHFIIDRWNLVGHYISIKNLTFSTENFGYKPNRPFSITVWLYIIQDNIMHLVCNFLIIKYLIF